MPNESAGARVEKKLCIPTQEHGNENFESTKTKKQRIPTQKQEAWEREVNEAGRDQNTNYKHSQAK